MRIQKISIRNLKFLDCAELDFDQDITLLYGQNGIGKTTFLEAISLLGHLSTMRRIELNTETTEDPIAKPSLFWEQLKANQFVPIKQGVTTPAFDQKIESYNREDSFAALITGLKAAKEDMDKWFNDFRVKRNGPAAIRFEIKLGDDTKIRFCVYKRNDDGLTITQALGRKKCDDLKMNESFAVIWDTEDSQDMMKMIKRYVESCTYMVSFETLNPTGNQADCYLLKHRENKDSEVNSTGHVFYLNTDLNDFGRMRDIRESVKDLDSDFVQEWINRFGIKLPTEDQTATTNPGTEEHLKSDLELIMNRVIARSSLFSLRRGMREFFSYGLPAAMKPARRQTQKLLRLRAFYLEKDGRLKLTTIREGHDEPKDVDFLSAGENECFFIFLYLLGTNITDSICLLDEPDLHLSQFSKRPFFEHLFALLKERNCQVIISTHSGFAYTHPRITERFLIRRLKKSKLCAGVKLNSNFDSRFTLKFKFGMAAHYVRTALSVLGIAGSLQVAIFVLLFFALGSFISDLFNNKNQSFHIVLTYYFTYPALVIAAILLYVQSIKYIFRNIRGFLRWKDLD